MVTFAKTNDRGLTPDRNEESPGLKPVSPYCFAERLLVLEVVESAGGQ